MLALLYAHEMEVGLGSEWKVVAEAVSELLGETDRQSLLGLIFASFLFALPRSKNGPRRLADGLWDFAGNKADFGILGHKSLRRCAQEEEGSQGQGGVQEVEMMRYLEDAVKDLDLRKVQQPSWPLRQLITRVSREWTSLRPHLGGCFGSLVARFLEGRWLDTFKLKQQLLDMLYGHFVGRVEAFKARYPGAKEGLAPREEVLFAAAAELRVVEGMLQLYLNELARVVPSNAVFRAQSWEVELLRDKAARGIWEVWVIEPEELYQRIGREIDAYIRVKGQAAGEGGKGVSIAEKEWSQMLGSIMVPALREQLQRERAMYRPVPLMLMPNQPPVYNQDVLNQGGASNEELEAWMDTAVVWAEKMAKGRKSALLGNGEGVSGEVLRRAPKPPLVLSLGLGVGTAPSSSLVQLPSLPQPMSVTPSSSARPEEEVPAAAAGKQLKRGRGGRIEVLLRQVVIQKAEVDRLGRELEKRMVVHGEQEKLLMELCKEITGMEGKFREECEVLAQVESEVKRAKMEQGVRSEEEKRVKEMREEKRSQLRKELEELDKADGVQGDGAKEMELDYGD